MTPLELAIGVVAWSLFAGIAIVAFVVHVVTRRRPP